MTTGIGLLQMICEHPDDDTPRLVFADFIEEHGDHDRGEFIRLQVLLAQLESRIADLLDDDPDWLDCTGISASWCPNCGDCTCKDREWSMSDLGCRLHAPTSKHCCMHNVADKAVVARARTRELWFINCREWVAASFPGEHMCGLENVGQYGGERRYSPTGNKNDARRYDLHDVSFSRGFPDSITCSAADWLLIADAVTQPLTRVTMTTMPRLHYYRDPDQPPDHVIISLTPLDLPAMPFHVIQLMHDTQATTAALLKERWPRIAFSLPTTQ